MKVYVHLQKYFRHSQEAEQQYSYTKFKSYQWKEVTQSISFSYLMLRRMALFLSSQLISCWVLPLKSLQVELFYMKAECQSLNT